MIPMLIVVYTYIYKIIEHIPLILNTYSSIHFTTYLIFEIMWIPLEERSHIYYL